MLVFYFGHLFVISLFCKVHSFNFQSVTTCGPYEFPCNDGSCVNKDRWCDSKLDCEDDSDELYCYFKSGFGFNKNPNRCNETLFFLCSDGRCIPAIGRCDGYQSCYDKSDEENCDTTENVSAVSTSWTTQDQKKRTTEKSFVIVNRNDFKTLENSNETLMKAGSLAEITIENTTNPVIASSNILKSHPSPDLKQMYHNHFQAIHLTNASDNGSNQDLRNSSADVNNQQGREFHSQLDSRLNAYRNEQNYTKSHVKLETSYNSTLITSSSNKVESKKAMATSEALSDQSNNSNNSEILNRVKGIASSLNIVDKMEDLEKGYANLDSLDFQKNKERALQWLINFREKDYGWGDETARALIALYMSDDSVIKQNERMLMTQQLHLKLFTSLSRNETKRIPLDELALYINALSASCDSPKNFYGYDLINILRQRTNAAQSSEFVTPFVYLVLCLNKVSSYEDVKRVDEMLHNIKIFRIDGLAVISLAATCISRNNEFSKFGVEQIAAKTLYRKIKVAGLPTIVYELALMTQALNEARINQDLWNRTEAMHRITQSQGKDGSFGDILSTYYALPTLSGKSLLWLGKDCPNINTDLIPVDILTNGKDKKFVHYSLRFGNPLKMSQSLMIKVQKNTSFMDIMKTAAAVNPVYEFKLGMSEGKPFVYSIGGTTNDAERSLYWTPYTSSNSSKEFEPFEGDIRSFIPAHGEYVAFWMKPLF